MLPIIIWNFEHTTETTFLPISNKYCQNFVDVSFCYGSGLSAVHWTQLNGNTCPLDTQTSPFCYYLSLQILVNSKRPAVCTPRASELYKMPKVKNPCRLKRRKEIINKPLDSQSQSQSNLSFEQSSHSETERETIIHSSWSRNSSFYRSAAITLSSVIVSFRSLNFTSKFQ